MTDDPFAHLIEPLRKLVVLRRERDKLREQSMAAEKRFDAQQAVVHRAMASAGKSARVSNIDLGEGYGTWDFQRARTVRGRVYDHEEAVNQATSLGKAEELLLPASHVRFRTKALNDFVKEALEHEQDLPPGFEPNINEYVSMSQKK